MDKRLKDLLRSRILTTREVAELTGLTEAAVKKRVERGKLDAVLKGNNWLFDRRDFEELYRSNPSDKSHSETENVSGC
jgi:excisionase family DNA binding protein